MKRSRKALIAVAAFAVALQATRAVGSSRAAGKLEAYRARAHAEMAELSAIARARPPAGVPRAQDCAAAYAGIAAPPGDGDPSIAMEAAFSGTLSPAATALLNEYRPFITRMRDAAQCSSIATDSGSAYPRFEPLILAVGSLLVLVEAHERRASGDIDGAVARMVDALRLAVDAGFVQDDLGLPPASAALKGLAELVSTQRLTETSMLERSLRAFEPSLPSPIWAVRRVRADFLAHRPSGAWSFPQNVQLGSPAEAMTSVFLTDDAVLVRWIDDVTAITEEAETALRSNDIAVQKHASEISAAHVWQPLRDSLEQDPRLGSLSARARARAEVLARHALALDAIALEKERLATGRYPEHHVSPPDPCAKEGAMHYSSSSDGTAYKLWSVGLNGRDDNGASSASMLSADVVVEGGRGR